MRLSGPMNKLLKQKAALLYCNGFQPFSSRGTFEMLLSVWRNLDTQNRAKLRILTEPKKDYRNLLGPRKLWDPWNPD